MGIYDVIKDAVNIAQKADNIELYRMILDIQKETLDLLEENRNLKDKIRNLKEVNITNDNLILKGHCYYIEKSHGILDGPFCTTCWDKDKKLIRMYIAGNFATCHVCKFYTSDYKKIKWGCRAYECL
ncbi:hypothetical protein J0B03_05455 [Alkalibacter rhizosphaerae]|uniref:Uncharacterized protein n=1 Tax=Alkalibacter rhizosphaerae TaxID=2815577 RepID=A0A974XIR1_9FIRM|nr:hypothetical protein [Alkalibacter rhizosphaerae]QSX09510.1 hypothetical protein J0B03_05455 [Alkalibacter rhizosphaerae]